MAENVGMTDGHPCTSWYLGVSELPTAMKELTDNECSNSDHLLCLKS